MTCRCAIKCVGDTVLNRPYRAILRREDVKATEKDRVEIYKSFRPGDVILARVVRTIFFFLTTVFIQNFQLPITEAQSYQLSTAENELGVVIAHSEFGHPLVPISWTEMQCTQTYVKEPRKVAKVVPESAVQ